MESEAATAVRDPVDVGRARLDMVAIPERVLRFAMVIEISIEKLGHAVINELLCDGSDLVDRRRENNTLRREEKAKQRLLN